MALTSVWGPTYWNIDGHDFTTAPYWDGDTLVITEDGVANEAVILVPAFGWNSPSYVLVATQHKAKYVSGPGTGHPLNSQLQGLTPTDFALATNAPPATATVDVIYTANGSAGYSWGSQIVSLAFSVGGGAATPRVFHVTDFLLDPAPDGASLTWENYDRTEELPV